MTSAGELTGWGVSKERIEHKTFLAKCPSKYYIARMRKRPQSKPDVNQVAAAAVSAITGTTAGSGEELLGSEALRKALREAKEKDKARSITRIKRAKAAASK